ncbi:phytoene/squalene synthase family protein [Candidatus Halobonum tyrrellensis]|uniref:Squalene/phytoene synthase n=1 Tax=Candidatus Halobonum tyrrellensis G22 TaxID=1324957 RepID=V4J0G1_9EURY|nr:phytoene/squalene synthase family protein [Candidatus Halobonum tyrrellensis]ESP88937.1 Squalene/phytoene synthase [Candidatus Halobonum tyrrellensis G22]
MVNDEQVIRSKRIQQRTGRTFHFATRLLPQRVRHPTYVLYAFFRVADEVVDAADTAPPVEQRAELDRLRDAALGRTPTDDAVLAAFSEMREEFDIADADVETFIDAMESDIDTDRYETYEELEAYMDGSAAAVGRMMTAVMDPVDPEAALSHATALGEAFQLTNFLRDVREDVVERDRVYLPLETLSEYGVTEQQVLDLEFDDGVADAIRHETRRAESLYKEGVAGIEYLPEDCQFSVLLAAVLYAEHHALIRDRGYDTLSATPQLGTVRKVTLLAKTRWAWFRTKDPEAVFRRVSCVPHGDHSYGGSGHGERAPVR